ncbi:MAG: acetate/propionate family kinase [Phycisphaera sp.]|nr:acetate/propionate family kinase [Phycisphaera sp.]
MLILVANLGSTSFKYKLFEFAGSGERVLAVGGADRLGQGRSNWSVEAGGTKKEGVADLDDHAAAVDLHLHELTSLGVIQSIRDLDAIGFKAVHGGPISGAVIVDDHVLDVMQQFSDVAPQHNPPYIAAMKAFAIKLPGVPQVAAFETAYHQTVPKARQVYGIPHEWTDKLGIRRYGFHGASHRYIATRMAQIAPGVKRIISCHLGGSCSICAIKDGLSVANSFGMTVQTGVFHASRVGDFDTFALLKLLKSGLSLDEIWDTLGKKAGLAGLSGVGPDMRDIENTAGKGNRQAQLALDAFVESCRHYVGAYLAVLNGADAVVFTGGVGQFGKAIRQAICSDMSYAGIALDPAKNLAATGQDESRIESESSKVQLWVVPTNEELIVARQAVEVLNQTQATGALRP